MAGCLLIHIGVDLTKEALWDSYSYGSFDVFEYGSVVAITIVMTAYGMTAGLALGVFNAALTFTLQSGRHVSPIRSIRTARMLRSSKLRAHDINDILDIHSRHISIFQLQGYLFFGNATILAAKVDELLQKRKNFEIKFIVLDFTLVLAIDSSAAETIANIYRICERNKVKLCYSRGSPQGFPCAVELSSRLRNLNPKSEKNENDTNNIEHPDNTDNLEFSDMNTDIDTSMDMGKEDYDYDDKKKNNNDNYDYDLHISNSKNNLDENDNLKNNQFHSDGNIVRNILKLTKIKKFKLLDKNDGNDVDESVHVSNSLDEGLEWLVYIWICV